MTSNSNSVAMWCACVENGAARLADHQRMRGETVDTVYPLTIGVEYPVFGMGIWENVLSLLVPDDYMGACFAPAGCFELGSHELPAGWEFALREGIRAEGRDLWVHPCAAIWGYPKLVRDPDHGGALEEGEDEAMDHFVRLVLQARQQRQGDDEE